MSREDDLLKYYKVPASEDLAYLPATYQPISLEEMDRRVAALTKRVADNVARIQSSAEFRNFLIAMSRFHNYSWNNQMLIWLQKPDVTHVAGYVTWRELGRQVKGGETGISVLAPRGPTGMVTWTCATMGTSFEIRRPDSPGHPNYSWGIYDSSGKLIEEFRTQGKAVQKLKDWGCVEDRRVLNVRHFKTVAIFDISQTTGKPLPEFEIPVLTGEANQDLFDWLLGLAKERNITVSFESRPTQALSIKGQYLAPNLIWVKPDEAPAQQLKTLLHELAHYYSARVFEIPRADAETIAESAAYVVGAHYGFDTGIRSFPYVALWARDEKVLHANMNSIQEIAAKIIDNLEERMKRLMPQTARRKTYDLKSLPGTTKSIKEGDYVQLKSGTEGWIKGRVLEYTDLITYPPLGAAIYTGPGYKVYILEGKHKGETIRVPANYVQLVKSSEPTDPREVTSKVFAMEQSYSLEQVKSLAREKGVSTSGSKRDILRRLAT